MSTLMALKSLASLNCEELSETLEENEYHNLANVVIENEINGNEFVNLTEYQVQQFKGCQHEKIARQIFAIQKSPNKLKIQDKFKHKNNLELPRSKSQVNFASRPLPSLPTENKLGATPKYVRFKSLPDKISDFAVIRDKDYTSPPPAVAKTSPLYETRRILRKQNEESNDPIVYQSPSSYYSCRSSISSGYGSILFEYDEEDDKAVYISNLKQNERIGIEKETTYFDVKDHTPIITKDETAESLDLLEVKNESSGLLENTVKTEEISSSSERILSNLHNRILQFDEATSSITKNGYSEIIYSNELKALAQNKINSKYKSTNMNIIDQTKLTSIEEQNDGTSSDDSLCEIEEKLILRLYKKELRKKLLNK